MAYLRRLLCLKIHLFVGVGGRGEVKKRREGLLEEVAVHVGTSLLCMCVFLCVFAYDVLLCVFAYDVFLCVFACVCVPICLYVSV